MGLLDRLPAWASTAVGSLPHEEPAAAVSHVASRYEVPFCPQLPRLEGDMITEWLGDDPGRCGWSPERDRERPRAWEELLGELERNPPSHRIVKLQVTGPATLACALERERGGAPSRRRALALARELSAWLAANVGEQVRTLGGRGLDAVLVVDEPGLHAFGVEGMDAAWDPLRAVASAWGLHICGRVPWSVVERAGPDIVSFDLAASPVDDEAAAILDRHRARAGWIAWGVVRVERSEPCSLAVRRLDAALSRLGSGASRSMLTAACGTGRASVAREREIATELAGIARAMRARSGHQLAG